MLHSSPVLYKESPTITGEHRRDFESVTGIGWLAPGAVISLRLKYITLNIKEYKPKTDKVGYVCGTLEKIPSLPSLFDNTNVIDTDTDGIYGCIAHTPQLSIQQCMHLYMYCVRKSFVGRVQQLPPHQPVRLWRPRRRVRRRKRR